jgi:sirohydrochlorin ferrochelatase
MRRRVMAIERIVCAVAAVAALMLAPAAGRLGTATDVSARTQARPGILLLAHGGSAVWNDNVNALAARVDKDRPVEVAFGMATRANIQTAVDKLVARGVTEIVAVPLFVSSHSSVLTSTQYLLGLRAEAPPELASFAKMSHGPAKGAAPSHDHHAAADPGEGTRPVKVPVPIRMTGALDGHPIVAAILADRARAISKDPAREAIVLVAHGPVNDVENQQWLNNLGVLASGIRKDASYASIDWMTVKDDAPPAIRDAATAELRALVTKRSESGARVLIVPVLLSYGGIEQGIRKRLDGLDYVMATQAIMPDDRLAQWIEAQLAGCPCEQ